MRANLTAGSTITWTGSIPISTLIFTTTVWVGDCFDLEAVGLPKERNQAEAKAEALLKEHIGLEAFDKLYQVGYIEVDSRKYAGRKYRVPQARLEIEVLDEQGRVIDRLCVHPREAYPESDELLARIVMLRFAEDKILEIANHQPVADCDYLLSGSGGMPQ